MKRLRDKIKRIRMMRWSKLTLGEKIIKVIIGLLKAAVIVAIAVTIAGLAVAIAAGLAVAFGIASALSGGFHNASKAYVPGDVYVKFR